jgi:hypothetical protein
MTIEDMSVTIEDMSVTIEDMSMTIEDRSVMHLVLWKCVDVDVHVSTNAHEIGLALSAFVYICTYSLSLPQTVPKSTQRHTDTHTHTPPFPTIATLRAPRSLSLRCTVLSVSLSASTRSEYTLLTGRAPVHMHSLSKGIARPMRMRVLACVRACFLVGKCGLCTLMCGSVHERADAGILCGKYGLVRFYTFMHMNQCIHVS